MNNTPGTKSYCQQPLESHESLFISSIEEKTICVPTQTSPEIHANGIGLGYMPIPGNFTGTREVESRVFKIMWVPSQESRAVVKEEGKHGDGKATNICPMSLYLASVLLIT